MAAITNVTPHTSVQNGNIPVQIEGTGFLTTELSQSFSAAPFYITTTAGGGAVSAPSASGIELSVTDAPGDSARVLLNDTFTRAFNVSLELDTNILTLPATDDAQIFSIRAEDQSNPQTYFDVTIGYKDTIGYFAKIEAWVMNTLEYSKIKAIGPYQIEALKIVRTDEKMTGYLKLGPNWIEIDGWRGFANFTSVISSRIANSNTFHAEDFGVFLKYYKTDYVVSVVHEPARILDLEDTVIEIATGQYDLPDSGEVILGLPDGTIAIWSETFTITESSIVQEMSVNFDMIISVYASYIKPTRSELFTSSGGFIWDKDEFLANGRNNDNLYVPSLWDPRLSNIPAGSLQSGHGFDRDVELENIKKVRRNGVENWYAKLNHGTFFIRNTPYYLFSDESITIQLGNDLTEDGRSKINLCYLPKPGIPISASSLKLDVRSGNIVNRIRFNKVVRFTGKASNGVELNTESPANIDKTLKEFRVIYNSNNMKTNWKIPIPAASNAPAGIYSFFLPEIPLFKFPVVFTRKDIFQNRKFVAKKYGDTDAIYNQFPYGTGVQAPGDYTVDYVTGEVQVWLDQDYIDIGHVTWTFDYPAIIEFNDDYRVSKGGGITSPTTSDLSELDLLGISNNAEFQSFNVSEFPIFDTSSNVFLDTNNIRVFTYDISTLQFDTSWQRVFSFDGAGPTSKVYIVDADRGTITFGNGINGMIPTKYHRIYASYYSTLRVEYEPVTSVDTWTGKSVDLNLSKNNLNSGFLYLSRKEQIPDSIRLEFALNLITALEFTALTATVLDVDGEPIPSIPVNFNVLGGAGETEETTVVSNSNGQAETIFIPNGSIQALGNFVQFFEAGSDSGTKGSLIPDSYQPSGSVPNAKIIAEEEINDDAENLYVFKILDSGDAFTPYDNQTRSGGLYQVYYKYNSISGENELIRPLEVNGSVLVFEEPLPQSHDPSGPNYDPNFRGLVVVGRKTVQARANVEYEGVVLESQTAFLGVQYSPIQKGEWTLPILPTTFTGSEIDRATYITINP